MDVRTRLNRKLRRNPAAILAADEVQVFVREAQRVLGRDGVLLCGGAARFEDTVRWGSLRARCERARAAGGMDIKSAARGSGIPRYRVEAIENGRLGELRPDLAWKYFDFIGIRTWVNRWIRSNADLAKRSGLGARQVAVPSPVGRKPNTAIQRSVSRVTALAQDRKDRATLSRR